MATVYLPVDPRGEQTSEERAKAINAEVWSLRRPDSVKSPNDVTKYYFATVKHPTTDQVAIVADDTAMMRIHPNVDLTKMLELLPEIPQDEKDQLVQYVDANRGGSVPFGTFIPSSSDQLTQEEAEAQGWFQQEELGFDEAEVVE